jgi:hypothetical protein
MSATPHMPPACDVPSSSLTQDAETSSLLTETSLNPQLSDSGDRQAAVGSGTQTWRTVPGYPEFEVTENGNIRENGGPARVRVAGSGHIYVLRSHSRPALLVHRAILMAWDRLPQPGEVCRHKDDNPANNVLSNLVWGTKKENAADRIINAPIKNPGWTEERRLLERIKGLEEENLKLKTTNMRLKASIMNLMADKSYTITQSLLRELGL